MHILNKERDHTKLGKAYKLFHLYTEEYLRDFYEDFCKCSTVLEYIEIVGKEINFHAGKREGFIYVHDLNKLFKSCDIIREAGGVKVCQELRIKIGKWLHPRFLEALIDVEQCQGLRGSARLYK